MARLNIFKNKSVHIDLNKFIDSRAVLCANSGAGKSYAIRKILEESNNKVMSIVLDVEGEFRTLREKFDFLLIGGRDCDVELNMKSASLLPKKLLELNVSTIIDISDLKMGERISYVKKFLEALMELPREYWKPCIIVLDEAHLLAGQQEKQDSTHSVIDLMTRGRKRGFCGILCSQRISKLHKDAVAEANNYLVGRTGLDIDMHRSSEILGFTSKEQMLSLRDLEPGEFYVFGPAISRYIQKEKIDAVQTTHPKVGMDIKSQIIKPNEKIKQMLSKLSELPQKAEEETRTLEDYKKKVRQLEFELRSKTPQKVYRTDDGLIKRAEDRGFNMAVSEYKKTISGYESQAKNLQRKLVKIREILEITDLPPQKVDFSRSVITRVELQKEVMRKPVIFDEANLLNKQENGGKLRAGAMNMLNIIASFSPKPITKNQVAVMAGFSYRGGTFNTYLSELKRNGWVVGNDRELTITKEGMENATNTTKLPDNSEDIIDMWASKFRAGAAKILKIIASKYPGNISKEELGEISGFTHTGGTFNTYISELRRAGLIEFEGGSLTATKELFLED